MVDPADLVTSDAERRAALVAAKLRALVGVRWTPGADAESRGFPGGSALVDRAAATAWVLVDEDPTRRLGGALALARRCGARQLHVLVEDPVAAGILARRASQFAEAPQVWLASPGPTLVAVDPAPPAPDAAPAPEAELYRPVLIEAGLEPLVEGGELIGELLGLEVARVVVDPVEGARVEAGVGRFDREAGSMMFAHLAEVDALARAVDIVARYRTVGAARHPLNQLVPERWLRSVLVEEPGLVKAQRLRPVGSAEPRRNLNEAGVASAVGTGVDGRPLVVTCSTGVDLDLVPSAADDRLTHAPDADLVLAVPAKDVLAITVELAALLARPALVVAIPDGWQGLADAPSDGQDEPSSETESGGPS